MAIQSFVAGNRVVHRGTRDLNWSNITSKTVSNKRYTSGEAGLVTRVDGIFIGIAKAPVVYECLVMWDLDGTTEWVSANDLKLEYTLQQINSLVRSATGAVISDHNIDLGRVDVRSYDSLADALSAAVDTDVTTGGDVVATVRRTRAVHVAGGEVVTCTATLPISHKGARIVSERDARPGGEYAARIVIDHDGAGIGIDSGAGSYLPTLTIVGVEITKQGTTHEGSGVGVFADGATWMAGLTLDGASVRYCATGIGLGPSYVSSTLDQVHILQSRIQNNGQGVDLSGTHVTNSSVIASSIRANDSGGLWLGAKGVVVENNTFESNLGSPLRICGTANRAVRIGPNYFEGILAANAGWGANQPCLIEIRTTIGFEVSEQQRETNIDVPAVAVLSSMNGVVEPEALLQVATNVTARNGVVLGTAKRAGCWAYSSARGYATPTDVPVHTSEYRIGYGDGPIDFGGGWDGPAKLAAGSPAVVACDWIEIDNWAPGDYLMIACCIQWQGDLPPSGSPGMVVTAAWDGDSWETDFASQTLAASSAPTTVGAFRPGETLALCGALKNTTAATYTRVRVSVYPFGASNTGSAAYVSPTHAWVVSDSGTDYETIVAQYDARRILTRYEWHPTDIGSGLVECWDPDSPYAAGTGWAGYGGEVLAPGTAPTEIMRRGYRVLSFNGTDQYLTSAFTLAQPSEVWLAARWSGAFSSGAECMCGGGDTTAAYLARTAAATVRAYAGTANGDSAVPVTAGHWSSWGYRLSGAESAVICDGHPISVVTGTVDADGLTIGANYGGANFGAVDIAAVVVLSRAATTNERRALRRWMSRWT